MSNGRHRVPGSHRVQCRVCHCTSLEPCNPPCGWERRITVSDDSRPLCTTCASVVAEIVDWWENAHRPTQSRLWAEVKRRIGAAEVGS